MNDTSSRLPFRISICGRADLFQFDENYASYSVSQQVEFVTSSALPGLKIVARRSNRDGLPLVLFHYLMSDKDRVIAVTCTCAEPAAAKYEPMFDAAMKSLQSERRNEK